MDSFWEWFWAGFGLVTGVATALGWGLLIMTLAVVVGDLFRRRFGR